MRRSVDALWLADKSQNHGKSNNQKNAMAKSLRNPLPPLAIDAKATQPLNAQLAASLRDAIRQGVLAPGRLLPPTREAALQLGLGRNTVVDAYSDLVAEGLLEARGRLGTFVATRITRVSTPESPQPRAVRRLAPRAVVAAAAVSRGAAGMAGSAAQDWRLGQSGSPLLPLPVWRAACREAGRHLPPPDYGDPKGLPALREAIAAWLRRHRGTDHAASQIIVTQGTGAALELLARVLVRPGDPCAVESPGYARAATAFKAAGGSVRPVPVDEHGMQVASAFADRAPTVLHLTPAHQYPLGVRLSGARRAELAQLATRHGSLVIENEYDHEFIYEGQNHAALAASLPAHCVLVSTFAKAISPALRMGFMAAPPALADTLALAIERERLHASWPVQVSLQWLLASAELQRHLRRVRRHHASQRDRLLLALRQACPDLHVSGQEGGLHIVLTTGHATLDKALAEQLGKLGVAHQTVREFGGRSNALLLGYGHMGAREIEQAAGLLAQALSRLKRRHRGVASAR
jgi:GntR family transcriptional regulator/MocR family aminotransferase